MIAAYGGLQLSFAQEAMWFHEQLHPGSCAYNVPIAVRVREEVDVTTLDESLAGVVARHEVLRTTFIDTPEGPRQVIAPTGRVPIAVVDLSAREPDEREAESHQILRADALPCGELAVCRRDTAAHEGA